MRNPPQEGSGDFWFPGKLSSDMAPPTRGVPSGQLVVRQLGVCSGDWWSDLGCASTQGLLSISRPSTARGAPATGSTPKPGPETKPRKTTSLLRFRGQREKEHKQRSRKQSEP